MKGVRRRAARWCGAAALACALAAPAAADTVKVGCVDFPPFTYEDADGRPAGRAIDLITDILTRAGLPFEIKCYPGARLMASLRDGSTHVAMLIKHPEVVEAALYGRRVMAYMQLNAYRLPETPALGGIENTRGKSVILLRGYGYGGWVDFFKNPANDLRLSFADSRPAALKMLSNGHGDYLMDYQAPAAQALNGTSTPALLSEPLVRLETYFLVSKRAPDAARLLKCIEDTFAAMGAKPVD
ncbi:MAG: transporter substrate-binding domain-containing protein [Magnetospirillum sp.]|nr:transporter substrate-binding domain-containing protein [Magnetospirillum sp.]